jgi:hypothetical protein
MNRDSETVIQLSESNNNFIDNCNDNCRDSSIDSCNDNRQEFCNDNRQEFCNDNRQEFCNDNRQEFCVDSYIECCICLNTFDYEFILMNCCKKYIHKQCLMDWILSEFNHMVKCPMCIQNIENINILITYEEFNMYINSLIEKEIYKNDNLSLVYIKFRFDRYLGIVNKLYNIPTYSTTDSEIEDINDKLRFGCRIIFIFIYFIFIILIVYILNMYIFKK